MRIRSVKPEFFTHPEIVALSIPARLLFVSMWTQADDEGRMYDQPRKIVANAFGDEDRVNPDRLMGELEERGRVLRYEASGKRCLQIVNFSVHQRIDKFRPSTIPPAPGVEPSTNPPALLDEDSHPDLDLDLEGNGLEGNGTLAAARRAREPHFDALCVACGMDPLEVTGAEAKAVGVCMAAVRKLKTFTVDEIMVRGSDENWQRVMGSATKTPCAICRNWARLAGVGRGSDRPEPQAKRMLALASELEKQGR